MTAKLILLRHGESEWNSKNLFTGWVDVDLNEKGEGEARHAADLLKEENLLPNVVHTSLLRRAIHTAYLALDGCDRHWIPVRRSWRLNERHYGSLQGLNKAETNDGEYSQFNGPRYADIPEAERPVAECLKDVVARMVPYFTSDIAADLKAGKTVLVAAHGNSLRALVKHLDEISDEDIAGLNIPTGIPLLYELDDNLKPVTKGGRYLDPEAAAAGAKAVANQGNK